MLGASHSSNYTLWKFGMIATDGMKEIAEWGNTYKGEQEMKASVCFKFLFSLDFTLIPLLFITTYM